MPVGATYAGMSEQQVMDTIRTTDLSETCRCVDLYRKILSVIVLVRQPNNRRIP